MKIEMHIDTWIDRGKLNKIIEIDDFEIEGMSDEEKEEYIQKEYLETFLYEYVEAWYEEIED